MRKERKRERERGSKRERGEREGGKDRESERGSERKYSSLISSLFIRKAIFFNIVVRGSEISHSALIFLT